MREIKFDAFIQIKKPTNDEQEFEHLPFSELLHEEFILFKDGILTTDEEDEHHKTIIRQYTGRKDKNGVEVYHKDIVVDDLSRHFWIEWNTAEGKWFLQPLYQHDGNTFYSNILQDISNLKFTKVIGNIYENKELLG